MNKEDADYMTRAFLNLSETHNLPVSWDRFLVWLAFVSKFN